MHRKSLRIINMVIVFILLLSANNVLAAGNSLQNILHTPSAVSDPNRSQGDDDADTNTISLPFVAHNPVIAPVIPDTTKVLSDDTTDHLTSVSPDGSVLTFSESSEELKELKPGEIIVDDPSPAAPDGFLRKVVDTSRSGGKMVVETTEATLEEAIAEGEVNFKTTLEPASIEQTTFLAGTTLNQSPEVAEGMSFNYNLNNVILYDADGNPGTTHDQVKANGRVALNTDIDFSFKTGFWIFGKTKISFVQTTSELAELEIIYESGYQLQKQIEIARHYFSPFTVWVGPVPVVFTPVLTVYVGVDGWVYTSVTSRVHQSASLSYGVKYDDGWKPIGSFNNSFSFAPPALDASLSIKGYAGTSMSLLLYGVVGPHADLVPFLLLNADINKTPWWQLYGGLEVWAGVKIEVLGKSVADYQTKVIEYSKLLDEASGSPPPPPPTCYALSLSHTGLGSNPVATPGSSSGCSPGYYVSGEFIQLSGAVPSSGWQIDSWYNTNNDGSTASTNSLTMPSQAITVAVNYTQIPLVCYYLTLSHTGSGSNPVASPSTAGCSPGYYAAGEYITLSGAVPSSGWQIDSWTNTNNDSSVASTNSLNMPGQSVTVYVNYIEEPATSSVTMDQVWTTDYWNNPKTTFRPGEAILLHLGATNHESYNIDVSYDWDVYDPYGGYASDLSYSGWAVNMSPGTEYWSLERVIQTSAALGTYSYIATLSHATGSDYDSTDFVVSGSPLTIYHFDTVTCRDIDGNNQPVYPTTYFTSSDDYVYVWLSWEAAYGSHTVRYIWYRPDGYVHDDYSVDFSTSEYVYNTWGWIPTGPMGSYTGEWHVDVFIDDYHEASIYFDYGG